LQAPDISAKIGLDDVGFLSRFSQRQCYFFNIIVAESSYVFFDIQMFRECEDA